MAFNPDLDKTLFEAEPLYVPVVDYNYYFRIKKYGNTKAKVEITKGFVKDDNTSGETQRLGRIDVSVLPDFISRLSFLLEKMKDFA